MILEIVGQRGSGAAGDVAPVVVAAGVDRPVLVEQVDPLQFYFLWLGFPGNFILNGNYQNFKIFTPAR